MSEISSINYSKKNWVDVANEGTPLTAQDLNRIEQGVVDLDDTLLDLQESVNDKLQFHELFRGQARAGTTITPSDSLSNYQILYVQVKSDTISVTGSQFIRRQEGSLHVSELVTTNSDCRYVGTDMNDTGVNIIVNTVYSCHFHWNNFQVSATDLNGYVSAVYGIKMSG